MDAYVWIDLVISRAPDLRKVGVVSIGVGGCTVTLGPEPLPDDGVSGDKQPDPPAGYLQDPATYPDGIVPGFQIHSLDEG